eukprot:1194776-Prorocentrum_minimum.AAC.6
MGLNAAGTSVRNLCEGAWPRGTDGGSSRGAGGAGAGEILLNCIDRDGVGEGFDLDLVSQVSQAYPPGGVGLCHAVVLASGWHGHDT